MDTEHYDIKPRSPVARLSRDFDNEKLNSKFDWDLVRSMVGMSSAFIRKVLGKSRKQDVISLSEVLLLLDQDAYSETFIPRSKIPDYLLNVKSADRDRESHVDLNGPHILIQGDAKSLIGQLPINSVRCVVTSTPYWGLRLYNTHFAVEWADGEICPFGHEQTPEGFIRHTTELLFLLKRVMKSDGSIWWNLMDTFNTRTQIRQNAAETLRAMQGKDERSWKTYACRRYSAGHSYLEDGELCMIPSRVAERASRIGYWVKSLITWDKEGSLPETVSTRVTREAEYVLHLSLQRNPFFDKGAFRRLPKRLGGRNERLEFDNVTDVWCLATATGTDGHGAQFPLALPGRCIGLSTEKDDIVLDPFVGSGTTSVAAKELDRRSVGFDVDPAYLETACSRISKEARTVEEKPIPNSIELPIDQEQLKIQL